MLTIALTSSGEIIGSAYRGAAGAARRLHRHGGSSEMRRIVRALSDGTVIAMLHHTVGVVPLVITAVGLALARQTTIDQEPG